jgi:uncharacterized protein
MHAFYFGSGTRRLFGVYEPSRLARAKPQAALLCNPWGAEYLHAHKSLRQLAIRLAEAGVDTLRFDYFATGDSSGADGEGSLEDWRKDILMATDELRSLSGATRISLVGLRLGATLAAQASLGMRKVVDKLVLWDPITDGGEYIEELYAACRAPHLTIKEPIARSAEIGGGFDILGFPLTQRIHGELNNLSIQAIASDLPGKVRTLISNGEASAERARSALIAAPAAVVENMESLPIWFEDWPRNSGVVPARTLQQIVQWVAS